MAGKLALGRGLGALIQKPSGTGNSNGGGNASAMSSPALHQPAPGERVQTVNVEDILPSPLQPRREFKADALNELVESIRERGIIQPLIVRRVGGRYELIAGERRWRAARQVGLAQAPVIVREASDQQVLELALIENLQRADLNILEEARAYHRLAGDFGLKQEDIGKKVGKSRAAVANAMRLLDLDDQVQEWLVQDRLSVGHAKVLLAVKSHDEQRALAEHLIRQGATVRAAEKLVAEHLARAHAAVDGFAPAPTVGPGSRRPENQLPPAWRHVENRIRERLQTHVALRQSNAHNGKGSIEIEFYGQDDLQRILSALGMVDGEAS